MRDRAPVPVDDGLPLALADAVPDLLDAPRARGWIHLYSAAVFAVIAAALVPIAWITHSSTAGWATLIYGTTSVALFGVSATYHRVRWRSASVKLWWKRADHSLIFVFIAGSYTPFALLAMPLSVGEQLLTVVYAGAAAGVALKMVWPSAPRAVGVPLYLLLGWAAVFFAPTLLEGAGLAAVVLLLVGAALYNVGAILYGLRWPNPWPQTFGYHEFFHALTTAAGACHFAAVCIVAV
ncbi:hemolysin III family protein [Mycobacterium sp. IDR2000157661]|nr:hemolysin III family protein [Mycobacterium sp. IDR2000157661]ULE33454.1 hemolysin III family protein [Mycobacterium sp. IDR2000157661]